MSRELVVNFESVQRLAGLLDAATDTIEHHLETLEVRSEQLRGQWTGEATQAYDLAHKRWTGDLRAMNLLLRQMGVIAARAGERHNLREQRNVSVWG